MNKISRDIKIVHRLLLQKSVLKYFWDNRYLFKGAFFLVAIGHTRRVIIIQSVIAFHERRGGAFLLYDAR